MNIKNRMTALALAVVAGSTMVLPMHATAQSQRAANSAASTISSFDVQQVQRLRPGEDLDFELRATPGSTAIVTIEGAGSPLSLSEVRPGVFQGSYTIRQSDRLSDRSRVTVRVLRNGLATSATMARSLVAGASNVGNFSSNAISDFKVSAPDRIRAGEELNFSVTGAPGGKARVSIEGAPRAVALREVSRGVYEGSYVVRRQDRLRGDLTATAYLVNGGRESSQRFERAQMADDNGRRGQMDDNNGRRGQMAEDNSRRAQLSQQAQQACPTCGTIESVNLVEAKDGGSNAIGTIAGGILGGVIGNQVGGGSGQDIARVIGAIGGAYAGNRVQNNMNNDKVYRVTVRLQGGGTQNFDYAQDPQVAVGTRVKVEGDVLVRQ